MKWRMRSLRWLIPALLICWTSSALAQRASETRPRIFRSRAAVAKTLGKTVADQIPPTFDFALFALVWPGLPHDEAATLKIVTLPAEGGAFDPLPSPAMRLTLTRTTTKVTIEAWGDNPCAGGMAKSQERIQACYADLETSIAEARKTLTLFATPRARLEKVKLIRRPMAKRP